jgi:hypothetical protein
MKPLNLNYWTGIAGFGFFIFNMIIIPLYFVYDGPPPEWNILTRSLIGMFACLALIFFVTGFRGIILKDNTENESYGTIVLVLGLTYALLLLVADALQVGSVWNSKSPIDPTLAESGGIGAMLIYGPMARLLSATFLVVAGKTITAIGIAPPWIKWLAYTISILHIALIPTIFNMTNPTEFYSTNGWNIPVAGGLFLFWVLFVSIFLIRAKHYHR